MKTTELNEKEIDWIIETLENDIIELDVKKDWKDCIMTKAEVIVLIEKLKEKN